MSNVVMFTGYLYVLLELGVLLSGACLVQLGGDYCSLQPCCTGLMYWKESSEFRLPLTNGSQLCIF